MVSQNPPVTFRLTSDDLEVLDELQTRTGLTKAGVLRLALRTLRDKLAREAPKARTTKR